MATTLTQCQIQAKLVKLPSSKILWPSIQDLKQNVLCMLSHPLTVLMKFLHFLFKVLSAYCGP